jgi:type II secretion system protein J
MELLIATAVFALILMAISGVFYGAMRLRSRTVETLEKAIPVQQSLALLRKDLAGLVVPGGVLSGELKTSVLNKDGGIEFYTATGLLTEDQPWAEVQKVSYTLVNPTDRSRGKDLVRVITRNLLPSSQEEYSQQWLMGGVQSLTFSFLKGTEWQATWDSTTEDTKLPKAVKINLIMEPQDDTRRPVTQIEWVTPIILQALTNTTQTASTQ